MHLLLDWMCDCLSTCDRIMLSIALSVVPRPCWLAKILQLRWSITWKLGHIPTCTLRGKDKVLMTTLLPNQLKIIYLNGRSTSEWTISPLISSHMKKDASGTRETDMQLPSAMNRKMKLGNPFSGTRETDSYLLQWTGSWNWEWAVINRVSQYQQEMFMLAQSCVPK